MCIQQKLMDRCLTDLFDNEKEMAAVMESIINLLEMNQLQSKLFLRKIKLRPSKELYLDTGFFDDTLVIHSPHKNNGQLLSDFIPAIQNSKMQTLLLLFATLKPNYREELLQQIRNELS